MFLFLFLSICAALQISEKDEAVLVYLEDITCEDLAAAPRPPKAPKAGGGGEEEEEEEEEEDEPCGFTLAFHFAPNPFFKHATLVGSACCAACLLGVRVGSSGGSVKVGVCMLGWRVLMSCLSASQNL